MRRGDREAIGMYPDPTAADAATPPVGQVLPLRAAVTRRLLDVLLNDDTSKAILSAYAEALGVPPQTRVNLATSGLALLVPDGTALDPAAFAVPEEATPEVLVTPWHGETPVGQEATGT